MIAKKVRLRMQDCKFQENFVSVTTIAHRLRTGTVLWFVGRVRR